MMGFCSRGVYSSRRKYERAEAFIRGGGRATKQSAAGRRRRSSASTATGPSRPTEAARGRPRPRLSAAVLSETLRIVRVEFGVTLSKSITWPACRQQLIRQVRIEQQVSDDLRCSHEPLGETRCLAKNRQQSVGLGCPSRQVPERRCQLRRVRVVTDKKLALLGDDAVELAREVVRPHPHTLAQLAHPVPHHALTQCHPLRQRPGRARDDGHLPAPSPPPGV